MQRVYGAGNIVWGVVICYAPMIIAELFIDNYRHKRCLSVDFTGVAKSCKHVFRMVFCRLLVYNKCKFII